jgi:hypothetical protein
MTTPSSSSSSTSALAIPQFSLTSFQPSLSDDRFFLPAGRFRDQAQNFAAFAFGLAAIGGILGATFGAPARTHQKALTRCVRRYSGQRVLDLNPKLGDETQNRIYEESNTVRVDFLVKKKFAHNAHIDRFAELSPEELEHRDMAMILDRVVGYDPTFLASTVSYGIVEEKETHAPEFVKYDSIVLDRLLAGLPEEKARKVLDEALRLCRPEGHVIIVDEGEKKNSWLVSMLARHFSGGKPDESPHVQDLEKWVRVNGNAEIIESQQRLFGMCHSLVVKPKTQAA